MAAESVTRSGNLLRYIVRKLCTSADCDGIHISQSVDGVIVDLAVCIAT